MNTCDGDPDLAIFQKDVRTASNAANQSSRIPGRSADVDSEYERLVTWHRRAVRRAMRVQVPADSNETSSPKSTSSKIRINSVRRAGDDVVLVWIGENSFLVLGEHARDAR